MTEEHEKVEEGAPMLGPNSGRIFLTETMGVDGERWAGPDIEAQSWRLADERAHVLGVRVIGMLYEVVPVDD